MSKFNRGTVLPAIVDRFRNLRNGQRKYIGKITLFAVGAKKSEVIAEVYGSTLKEMRARKHAVAKTLQTLEDSQ